MKLTFFGATDDVTGSMTLIDFNQGQVLVDCGMTQGPLEVLEKNFIPLPFISKNIKAIVLTHAHLDHCGMIPHLVKLGFRGKIYCTQATSKLVAVILKDSAKLIEKNTDQRFQQFYSMEDVTHTLSLFHTVEFGHSFDLLESKAHFQPAGHILGAASLIIQADKTIVFSGDLGRSDDPLMLPPEACPQADLVVMESTYGSKVRTAKIEDDLKAFIDHIYNESRIGLIASFAVARGQMLATLISEYFKKYPEKKMRFIMDGPMMKQANHVYQRYAKETKIPDLLFQAIEDIEVIEHQGEWESLKKKKGPLMIMSSSGMANGGMIWRHLENLAENDRAVLFLPGFQGKGTTGRLLSEGQRTVTSPDGTTITWTGEIIPSEAFSSHADQLELTQWIGNVEKDKNIYLVHGEESSKLALQTKLKEFGFINIKIPKRGDTSL